MTISKTGRATVLAASLLVASTASVKAVPTQNVPENTSTLVLLGVAAAGLAVLKRGSTQKSNLRKE